MKSTKNEQDILTIGFKTQRNSIDFCVNITFYKHTRNYFSGKKHLTEAKFDVTL